MHPAIEQTIRDQRGHFDHADPDSLERNRARLVKTIWNVAKLEPFHGPDWQQGMIRYYVGNYLSMYIKAYGNQVADAEMLSAITHNVASHIETRRNKGRLHVLAVLENARKAIAEWYLSSDLYHLKQSQTSISLEQE